MAHVWFLWAALLALSSCSAPLGDGLRSCRVDADCGDAASTICAQRCLPRAGDFDADGVTNAREVELGLDPWRSDSDGDGWLDGFELGPNKTPADADADGKPDALERKDADSDSDCLPDERDAADTVPTTDEINLRRGCRTLGRCTNTFARQRASCVAGVLTCTLDGAPYPVEVCNEEDDDCDGQVDEGCDPQATNRGAFAAERSSDVPPGRLRITKPLVLTAPDQLPLEEKHRFLSLGWVTEVEAVCAPAEGDAAPPEVFVEVTPRPPDTAVDAGVPRDARGRPASLHAAGTLEGALALEHFAGQRAMLTIVCRDRRLLPGEPGLSVSIPVLVSAAGPEGETLPALSGTAASCSTGAGLLPLAMLVFIGRRRRRGLVLLTYALAACGGGTPMLTPGQGTANALPLWPMGGVQLPSWLHTTIEGRSETPLAFGLTLHSQRAVEGGVEHRFDKGFTGNLAGMAFVIDAEGNLRVSGSHYGAIDPPMLLVPKTVRVGMTWEATHALETDTLRHELGDDAPLDFGDGRWRFTVSHRQVVHTRWGVQTLWRIEWVGPPIPFSATASGLIQRSLSLIDPLPVEEQARLRGFFDFVEGFGPVAMAPNFHALDSLDHYGYPSDKQPGPEPTLTPFDSMAGSRALNDGASTLAERAFPPVVDGAGLAGTRIQDAPTLAVTPVSAGSPLTEGGLYAQQVWLTRSSKEGAGELVVAGDRAPRSGFIDPNGNTTGVYFPQPSFGCATVSDDGKVSARAATDPCPRRVDSAGSPWVHPDGTRWDAVSISSVLSESRSPTNERPRGFEAFAPFWHQGVFMSLGSEVGVSGQSPLALRAFGAQPVDDLLDDPRIAGDAIPGIERFALTADTSAPGSINVALPSEEGLTYFTASRPWSLGTLRLPGFPWAEALWLGWDGKPQERLPLSVAHLGWTLVDGAHVVTEMGQLGELRVLHFEGRRVWAELLGRASLPKGHLAVGAVKLAGDTYLVLTQLDPEFRITRKVDTFTSMHGLEQLPPRAGELFGFTVNAPSTGLVDHDWALRQVYASVGQGALRVCVPSQSGLEVVGLRIGARMLEGSELRRGADCWESAYLADDALRTEAAGWTPLAIRIEGEGWLYRPLPALPSKPALPMSTEVSATLRDGSRLYPSTWVAPFDTTRLPVSTRVPQALGSLLDPGVLKIPDVSGAGLWALNLVPNRCTTSPHCLDGPYAPDGGMVGYALADRLRHRMFWGPAGISMPVSTGGLIGNGWHLSPDGGFTRLPGMGAFEGRFSNGRRWWAFLDGRVCGQFSEAEGLGIGCYSAQGEKRVLELSFADAPSYLMQEPGFLIRPVHQSGRFRLELVDVRSGERRLVDVGPVSSGQLTGPELGTDGTLWWVLGGATRLLVGVSTGRVETFAAPAGEQRLWAATGEYLWWLSGLRQARPASDMRSCGLQVERCNGLDDDCDGETDEGDLCVATNAEARCAEGRCERTRCLAGFDDCNQTFTDGCEASLGTTSHCLRCGDVCAAGATCAPSGCGLPPQPTLAAGESFMCAKTGTGDVSCLGGPWPQAAPPNFTGALRVVTRGVEQLAAGAAHACVRSADGGVGCWGTTDVALGPAGNFVAVSETPALVTGLPAAEVLWAGGRNTCARVAGGALWCWGPILSGLVTPMGSTDVDRYQAYRTPTQIPGWSGVRSLAMSGDRACGVRGDGSFACFGPSGMPATFGTSSFTGLPMVDRVWGASGQLDGAGRFAMSYQGAFHALGAWQATSVLLGPATGPWLEPQRIAAVDGALSVGVGPMHACFVFEAETRCAGVNTMGQLGQVDSAGVFGSWVTRAGRFVDAAATASGSCLVSEDRTVSCVGRLADYLRRSPRSSWALVGFGVP